MYKSRVFYSQLRIISPYISSKRRFPVGWHIISTMNISITSTMNISITSVIMLLCIIYYSFTEYKQHIASGAKKNGSHEFQTVCRIL